MCESGELLVVGWWWSHEAEVGSLRDQAQRQKVSPGVSTGRCGAEWKASVKQEENQEWGMSPRPGAGWVQEGKSDWACEKEAWGWVAGSGSWEVPLMRAFGGVLKVKVKWACEKVERSWDRPVSAVWGSHLRTERCGEIWGGMCSEELCFEIEIALTSIQSPLQRFMFWNLGSQCHFIEEGD